MFYLPLQYKLQRWKFCFLFWKMKGQARSMDVRLDNKVYHFFCFFCFLWQTKEMLFIITDGSKCNVIYFIKWGLDIFNLESPHHRPKKTNVYTSKVFFSFKNQIWLFYHTLSYPNQRGHFKCYFWAYTYVNLSKIDSKIYFICKKQFLKKIWSEVWKRGEFQLMQILGLIGMYFDAEVVFVTSHSLFFKLTVAILCYVHFFFFTKRS